MDAERRREVEELFEEALEHPHAARRAWLRRRPGLDAALLAEVEALLDADEVAGSLFDAPPPAEERKIGPYRVLRELGRGGMGVVYLAERDDGHFRHRVAVKLLRGSPDAEDLHRRFLAERQILASLNHPHIAQLLDGGVTDGQLPYLVTEFVDGVPITEYCDRNRLGVRARLALLQQVCAAVHHAHQNLVVHRDLKPGNVLVTDRREVKLLDFGIAKLLNPVLGPAAQPLTRTEFRAMTPEYASPEQLRGETITTASDVYALGVLLYELLTGVRPHPPASSRAEAARRVADADPERPSSALTRRPDAPDELAAARDTSLERLRRTLRGDLDAIALMALRREPGRRYGSAELLAQDIERYLRGLPVLAHRGSGAYRLGKLVRRHRAGALATAMVALSLVGGTAVATREAADGRREQRRADRARQEAEAVSGFLMGLFEAGDPAETGGDEITARLLLERGLARAEALDGEPHVQAGMLEVIGRVYASLGRYEDAQGLLERALALREAQHGREHADVAVVLTGLADVLARRGRFDSAQSVLHRVRASERRLLSDEDAAASGVLLRLSRLEVSRGDLVAAETHAREALEARRGRLGPRHPLTLESLAQLGAVLRERGDYAGAERALREAVRLRDAEGSGAERASDLLGLAELTLLELRRPGEAEDLFRQALRLTEADPRAAERQRVRALGGLARVLEGRGELAAAEAQLREAVDLRRRTYGPEHLEVAAGLAHLAGFLQRTGQLAGAEETYREVEELEARVLGADHPRRAGTLTALGQVLNALGRFREADAVLEEATSIRIARLGADHPLVARTLRRRAEGRLRRGDHAAAEELLLRARRIETAQAAGATNFLSELDALLVELYTAWNRPGDAARFRATTAH
jgi:eukaryotic-like serine/threonine-protein kinase